MLNDFDSTDESWHLRAAAWLARKNKQMRSRHWLYLFGGALALFSAYTLVCFILGFGNAIDEKTLRASSFYGTLPSHIDAYRWLGESDPLVGEHVILARKKLVDASALVLVGSKTDELLHTSAEVDCNDLFTNDRNVSLRMSEMFHWAATFLKQNANATDSCACAPMFGIRVRHLALRVSNDDEHPSDGVVHALNVIDDLEKEYDALNSDVLLDNYIKLTVVNESQNERYNEERGSFAIIRRTRIRVLFLDRFCHKQVNRLTNTLAICAQRCFDMMRGIDVRERARMQWRLGVRLNEHIFGPPPNLAPPQTQSVEKDELK